jgi:hypothetical protein
MRDKGFREPRSFDVGVDDRRGNARLDYLQKYAM